MPPKERLYFAYGSNLSLSQMAARCSGSKYKGIAFLPNHEFVISPRGYANIRRVEPSRLSAAVDTPHDSGHRSESGEMKTPSKVWGLIYALTRPDEELLDGFEGVPFAYGKFDMEVSAVFGEDVNGGAGALMHCAVPPEGTQWEVVSALVYVDLREGEGVPVREYVGRMNRGIEDARRLGVPEEYLGGLRRWISEE